MAHHDIGAERQGYCGSSDHDGTGNIGHEQRKMRPEIGQEFAQAQLAPVVDMRC